MARKLPAMMFYTGDWLKDPQLSLCEPATRGIWMDLLCAMHEDGRLGQLRGTTEQLARVARCSTAELSDALTDLKTTHTAEVEQRNGSVTVSCRRMQREADKRLKAAERQRKKRCHTNVAPIEYESEEQKEKEVSAAFERFWEVFPKGRKKSKGSARDAWWKAVELERPEVIISAAEHYAQSPDGKGKYVKMPSTWLNQECWKDDRAAWEGVEPNPAADAQRKRDEERAIAQRDNAQRQAEAQQADRNLPSLAEELKKKIAAKHP